ncbi:hypothetical protein N7462_003904 [Penicillium macrosclerotiorum]|uniref:uncharacterized protein n=1 Tax=Penicillium macrosclerotiorum TaxID=303699 RepID=UPI00254733EB|nr:uncharacterized protein N7462_003904 [Penicillium macrosclerotiorum]KAJ5689512.1 hypothetical protein N7462_003904 [Penicillium macrosclerotiorum]
MMGFSSHHRNLSPTGGRHLVAGPRASTGMVQLASSVDPYEAPRFRHEYDDPYYYPSDVGYSSTYRHHPRHRSTIDAQPISTQKYHDSRHLPKKRTEYAIQPQSRHRSHTASGTDLYGSPPVINVASSSSSHLRPVISSPRGNRSPSPLPSDSNHYLMPASAHSGSHHRRGFSTDYASDTGHRDSRDGARRRTSRHHGADRVHPPPGRRRYPPYDGLKKGGDIDDYDAYSYTTPREQFDRDYPVQPRHSGIRSSIERPMSMNLAEDLPQWMGRSKDPRHHGPPPTSRGLDKLDREGRPRVPPRNADDRRDASRPRGGHDRALVPLPRESEDGYDSYSDAHHRRRRHHRRPRREGDRRHPDDQSPRRHNGMSERALALGGLGTAALGSGYSDVSDYDHQPTRRHRRRPREDDRDYDSAQPLSRENPDSAVSGPERSKQLYLEPADAHRHRSRSRRRHGGRRSESDDDSYSDDDDLRKYRREPSAAPRRSRHSSTDTSSTDDHVSRRPRDRSHHRSRSQRMLEDSHSTDKRRSPPVDMKEDVRKPVAVEPAAPKEPEAAPKSILKPPRKSFPEEPNPIREGVAPLKDANKNGIPPGARWTKIDRRLVNPEALDAGNERYEERSDYVIVLRVLNKEEIQAYAEKTQEIRGKHSNNPEIEKAGYQGTIDSLNVALDIRHKEQMREKRQRIEDSQRHGHRGEESSSDDEDEEEDEEKEKRQSEYPREQLPPKKIEPPPFPVPNSSLPMRPRPSSNSPPLPERPKANHFAAPA